MQNIREAKEKFVQEIMNIVYKVLRKEKVLQGEWHLGKVESVISPTQIKCFIDGGTVAQTVAANPDVTFAIGNEIWIIYPNRDSNSKFALCKRGI